jgi:hypothetical protein
VEKLREEYLEIDGLKEAKIEQLILDLQDSDSLDLEVEDSE